MLASTASMPANVPSTAAAASLAKAAREVEARNYKAQESISALNRIKEEQKRFSPFSNAKSRFKMWSDPLVKANATEEEKRQIEQFQDETEGRHCHKRQTAVDVKTAEASQESSNQIHSEIW